MQKSLAYLLLQYMHKTFPDQKHFSLKEIWENQDDAQEYYLENLPFKPKEKVNEIVAKHGFSPKEWEEVMQASQSFYFLPTPEMQAANKEIRAMFKGLDYINRIAGLRNYLSSILQNATKSNKLKRTKVKGYWHYSLKNPNK